MMTNLNDSRLQRFRRQPWLLRVLVIGVTCFAIGFVTDRAVADPNLPIGASSGAYAGLQAGHGGYGGHLRVETEPLTCRPEPPDYPGCTVEQTRPYRLAAFRDIFTGHAAGYKNYAMSQHNPGNVLKVLPPPLNRHLALKYHQAVTRYDRANATVRPDGTIINGAAFPTWYSFKNATASMCFAHNVLSNFPVSWCYGMTKAGQAGEVVRNHLWGVHRFVLGCNSYSISGFATGAVAAMKWGTETWWKGGFYGAGIGQLGCQVENFFGWTDHLGGKRV